MAVNISMKAVELSVYFYSKLEKSMSMPRVPVFFTPSAVI